MIGAVNRALIKSSSFDVKAAKLTRGYSEMSSGIPPIWGEKWRDNSNPPKPQHSKMPVNIKKIFLINIKTLH